MLTDAINAGLAALLMAWAGRYGIKLWRLFRLDRRSPDFTGLGQAIAQHCAREALAAAQYERIAWDNGRGAFWFDPDRYKVPWNKWTLEQPVKPRNEYETALRHYMRNIYRPDNYTVTISGEDHGK